MLKLITDQNNFVWVHPGLYCGPIVIHRRSATPTGRSCSSFSVQTHWDYRIPPQCFGKPHTYIIDLCPIRWPACWKQYTISRLEWLSIWEVSSYHSLCRCTHYLAVTDWVRVLSSCQCCWISNLYHSWISSKQTMSPIFNLPVSSFSRSTLSVSNSQNLTTVIWLVCLELPDCYSMRLPLILVVLVPAYE